MIPRYVPGKGDLETLPVRFAAMHARQRIVEITADFTPNSGELSISFANSDSQSLPLLAERCCTRAWRCAPAT